MSVTTTMTAAAPKVLTTTSTGIRHAPLVTISLSLLEQSSPSELAKFVAACKTPGFFYLDVSTDPRYTSTLDVLYAEAKTFFDQSKEAKMADFRESVDRGYKHYPDCETLEIAREEILRASPSAIPSSMRTHAEMLQYFITASHDITLILLNHLSKALNMPSLLTAHSDKHNDCALKFESVPMEARLEDVPFSEHTDMGTFTLLFCPEYTTELPVRSSSSSTAAEKAWEFIEPRAGCAIVNVADSLQRLTDGELVSSLHRVGQPLASAKERFCLLYYLRPDAQ